jgi:putative chitinase
MPITQPQLLQSLPSAGKQAGFFASVLNLAMDRYQIKNRLRMSALIAQVGLESGQFHYVRKLVGDQYLSKYDTGPLAKRLGNTLGKI